MTMCSEILLFSSSCSLRNYLYNYLCKAKKSHTKSISFSLSVPVIICLNLSQIINILAKQFIVSVNYELNGIVLSTYLFKLTSYYL